MGANNEVSRVSSKADRESTDDEHFGALIGLRTLSAIG